jgi:hypothetical protein
MYLLYQKLGVSAIIGAACCILTMTPLQFLIGKKMSTNSKTITVSVLLYIHTVSPTIYHSIQSSIITAGILLETNAGDSCYIQGLHS